MEQIVVYLLIALKFVTFKAKDSDINPISLCLGKISRRFSR